MRISCEIASALINNRYSYIDHEYAMQFFETARKICFVAAMIFTITFHIERGATLLFMALVLDITLSIDRRREQQTLLVQTTLENRAAEIAATNQHLTTTTQQFRETLTNLGATTTNYGQITDAITALSETLGTTVAACEHAVNRIVAHSLQNPV